MRRGYRYPTVPHLGERVLPGLSPSIQRRDTGTTADRTDSILFTVPAKDTRMWTNSLGARLTPLFAVMTLPLGILAAIFFGLQASLAVFVVGWLLLTPASAILFGPPGPGPTAGGEFQEALNEHIQEEMKQSLDEKRAGSDTSSSTDPVEELRQRYARGEIDEQELERGLDALLETEDVDADDEQVIERAIGNLDTDDESRTTGSRRSTESDSEHLTERE
jgi:hypothetical protein